MVANAPIGEEILFRGLLQGILLHRIPIFFITKLAPGKASLMANPMMQAARILLTSTALSGVSPPQPPHLCPRFR